MSKRTKWLGVLALVLGLSFVGFLMNSKALQGQIYSALSKTRSTSTTSEKDPHFAFNVYTDAKTGISFTLPEDWEVMKGENVVNTRTETEVYFPLYIYYAPDGKVSADTYETVEFTRFATEEEWKTEKQRYKDLTEVAFDDWELSSSELVKVGGFYADLMNFERTDMSGEVFDEPGVYFVKNKWVEIEISDTSNADIKSVINSVDFKR